VTERLTVDLAGRAYDIVVGAGLLARVGEFLAPVIGRRRLIVVTDETVAQHHLAALQAGLDAAGYRHAAVIVPAGESSKDLHRFADFAEQVLDQGIDRNTVLVAFGGGVVGDLAGFGAATVLRGVDFVQIPTTLLAQVDSSVGGKTGVDTRHGKNLVGAFHQPRLVLADLDVLKTLPHRELLAGYAEMVKYGILGDVGFFEYLESAAPRILALDPAVIGHAVLECCRMKAAIVAEDEREAGRRALLNLGHTFGHALEAETGYGSALLHGEAVAIGMVLAAEMSVHLGLLDKVGAERIRRHLDALGLPTSPNQVPGAPFKAARLIEHMSHDKKTIDGKLTFVLLDRVGHSRVERDVPAALVERVLTATGAA
jgi:3-dehydroquinate synthase